MAITFPVLPVTGHIVVDREEGVDVLRMVGEIGADTVAAYEAKQHPQNSPVITALDLTEVTFLSSSGIGFLLRRTRRARQLGEVLQLLGASSAARRVLRLAGVADLFQERVAPAAS